MRRPHTFVLAAVVSSLALVACSDDDETFDPPTTPAAPATTEAAGGSDGTVTSDAPDGTGTTDSAPAAAAPTTAPDTAGGLVTPLELDECLVGSWTLAPESIGGLVSAAFLPVGEIDLLDGAFVATFGEDGALEADADVTIAFALGATPAEADVDYTGTGTWGTLDGEVVLEITDSEGGLTELRLDGAVQPDTRLDAELPLAGGAYTCSASELQVTGTTNNITYDILFER